MSVMYSEYRKLLQQLVEVEVDTIPPLKLKSVRPF